MIQKNFFSIVSVFVLIFLARNSIAMNDSESHSTDFEPKVTVHTIKAPGGPVGEEEPVPPIPKVPLVAAVNNEMVFHLPEDPEHVHRVMCDFAASYNSQCFEVRPSKSATSKKLIVRYEYVDSLAGPKSLKRYVKNSAYFSKKEKAIDFIAEIKNDQASIMTVKGNKIKDTIENLPINQLNDMDFFYSDLMQNSVPGSMNQIVIDIVAKVNEWILQNADDRKEFLLLVLNSGAQSNLCQKCVQPNKKSDPVNDQREKFTNFVRSASQSRFPRVSGKKVGLEFETGFKTCIEQAKHAKAAFFANKHELHHIAGEALKVPYPSDKDLENVTFVLVGNLSSKIFNMKGGKESSDCARFGLDTNPFDLKEALEEFRRASSSFSSSRKIILFGDLSDVKTRTKEDNDKYLIDLDPHEIDTKVTGERQRKIAHLAENLKTAFSYGNKPFIYKGKGRKDLLRPSYNWASKMAKKEFNEVDGAIVEIDEKNIKLNWIIDNKVSTIDLIDWLKCELRKIGRASLSGYDRMLFAHLLGDESKDQKNDESQQVEIPYKEEIAKFFKSANPNEDLANMLRHSDWIERAVKDKIWSLVQGGKNVPSKFKIYVFYTGLWADMHHQATSRKK